MNQEKRMNQQGMISKAAATTKNISEARQFALSILADPILKDLYTRMAGRRCTAYSLAMSEFLIMREGGQWIF